MPKLSIITVNYNNDSGLQETIKSVLAQTYNDYEYIIIDGGSTDGSRKLLENYKDKISYYVSEKDNGIYNAMNKGIVAATGDYIIFLNSGDLFNDEDVIQDFVSQQFTADIVYGNLKFANGRLWHLPEKISFEYLYYNALAHPAQFIHKSAFIKCGMYEEQLKIVSDWLFCIKALVQFNVTLVYYNRVISIFDENGVSSVAKPLADEERRECLQKYFPLFIKDYNKMAELKKENILYKKSRLANWALDIQKTKLYKLLRK